MSGSRNGDLHPRRRAAALRKRRPFNSTWIETSKNDERNSRAQNEGELKHPLGTGSCTDCGQSPPHEKPQDCIVHQLKEGLAEEDPGRLALPILWIRRPHHVRVFFRTFRVHQMSSHRPLRLRMPSSYNRGMAGSIPAFRPLLQGTSVFLGRTAWRKIRIRQSQCGGTTWSHSDAPERQKGRPS